VASEFDAESVMSLLDEPALRRAFDIDENELPRLRDWVKASGIRWGVEGAIYNWRAGLQRLLLGVALPDAPERLWNDLLPVTGIEGERAELLGRFADFAEALFDLNTKVGAGRTALEWNRILATALERFLAPTEAEESQAQRLREVLGQLGELARAANCTTHLPLSVMLRELDAQLAEQAPAQAFASGAATIAALQPGRPLPARVVCLIGMNDGAWPRPATPLGFDLMASHPRPGDFNRRGEERHAFLETLLCATDALVVTYTGRDPRSNLEQPPAAPLAELIDTLTAMTGTESATLVVQHPLQPFGADYFEAKDPRLFSFDVEHCATGSVKTSPSFISYKTRLEPREIGIVELDRLQRFFSNPARYFLRECLGIHLEENEELLEIIEPFVPDRLEAYRLREAHFAALAAGMSPGENTRLLRARGWLPQGVAGDLADRTAHDEAAPLWQAARAWVATERLPLCEIIFAAGGINLTGCIDGLSKQGLWRVRHGNLRSKDRLRLWIDHLVLNIAAPAGVVRQSVLFARDGALHLAPEPRAAEYLADLLAIYREGLQSPLSFFAETAWAWLEQKNWRRTWEGDTFNQKPGERDDPYVRLALRDRADDPLGESFQQLATRILGPLRDALKNKEELSDG
jgi:exodeoxyribonuclease V gamma subunit